MPERPAENTGPAKALVSLPGISLVARIQATDKLIDRNWHESLFPRRLASAGNKVLLEQYELRKTRTIDSSWKEGKDGQEILRWCPHSGGPWSLD